MVFLRRCVALAAAAVVFSGVSAAESASRGTSISTFQSGDRWCVVGDSITHGGSYHQFAFLYYMTRFPDRTIDMYNCGISGDTAAGTLRRLKWDILSHKPTVASIMLGMNDVNVFGYGPDKNSPQDEQDRKAKIDVYADNMRKLISELQSAGVKVVLITPSIYDQTAEMPGALYFGANDGLGICSQRVRALAKEFGDNVVDFHGPMTRLNAEQQKADPKFTLVGGDRVHPGDVGHMVMAYLFLKGQGAPQYVSYMKVDASARKAVRETNCAISGLTASKKSISFTCRENALPFPVAESAQQALKIVPFTEDLNQEILQVTGLKAGRYEVKIDGQPVGTYSGEELGTGVNMATVTTTPQCQQAQAVMKLNQKRHSLEANELRGIDLLEYLYCPQRADGPVKLEDARPTLTKIADDAKGKPWAYLADLIGAYFRNKPREAEIRKEVETAVLDMRKIAQPKPHQYSIRQVD